MFMSKVSIILAMIFCHILDDYTLQGWLANAKQISWWKENAPQKMYRNDWAMALIMHSMSWSFMVMLPIALHLHFQVGLPFFVVWMWNAGIHAVVDDQKANKHSINLITDQMIHLIQIAVTFVGFLTGVFAI